MLAPACRPARMQTVVGPHAGRKVPERCVGLETNNAEADPPDQRGTLSRAGKRATRAPVRSAGVVAAACMEGGSGRNAGSPAGGVARANRRPVRARSGRTGWRRGSYYRGGRVMLAEGRSFRWRGWRKRAGSREWLTPITPEMSSNAGRHHMHKRRGRPARSPSSGRQQV